MKLIKKIFSEFLTWMVACLVIIIMIVLPPNKKTKQVPKSIECHEYIAPCSEEITFNTDIPNKCWIEED